MKQIQILFLSLGFLVILSACGETKSSETVAVQPPPGNYRSGACGQQIVNDVKNVFVYCDAPLEKVTRIEKENQLLTLVTKEEIAKCENVTSYFVETYPEINCTMRAWGVITQDFLTLHVVQKSHEAQVHNVRILKLRAETKRNKGISKKESKRSEQTRSERE